MTTWVRDLLGLWATMDWTASAQNLGYPPVACGFSLTSEDVSETDDTVGYTPAEIQAIADGVSWLAQHRPDAWRALSRDCRPWTRRTLAGRPGDADLVNEAMRLLGEFVDKQLQ